MRSITIMYFYGFSVSDAISVLYLNEFLVSRGSSCKTIFLFSIFSDKSGQSDMLDVSDGHILCSNSTRHLPWVWTLLSLLIASQLASFRPDFPSMGPSFRDGFAYCDVNCRLPKWCFHCILGSAIVWRQTKLTEKSYATISVGCIEVNMQALFSVALRLMSCLPVSKTFPSVTILVCACCLVVLLSLFWLICKLIFRTTGSVISSTVLGSTMRLFIRRLNVRPS